MNHTDLGVQIKMTNFFSLDLKFNWREHLFIFLQNLSLMTAILCFNVLTSCSSAYQTVPFFKYTGYIIWYKM